jgi:hypothetical protein
MPAEVVAPENPVSPPSPGVPVENSTTPVDQAKLQDMQQVGNLEGELSEFVTPKQENPVDSVEHDGKTLLQGTHAYRIEGDAIVIEETPGEFKADLKSPPDDNRRWFAVWIERMAKVWHKVLTFGKDPQI